MRIEDPAEVTPSTSGIYAPYEVKKGEDPLFGYNEKVLSPWVKKRYKLSMVGLHEEILDIYNWLRPSKVETALRYEVFDRVKKIIVDQWKDFDIKVSVFGSLRTNLFLPTSDIDVLVECDKWGGEIQYYLSQTARALDESGMASRISVFGDAFVPIVKMVDKDTLVSIDISFNTIQGVRAADYIEKVKQEFPVVEPLILILKQFLIQKNLNQTYTGGLSSYGLILMLISFLQIYAMPVRGKFFYDQGVNLGELLMRFFEVYAQEFNYLEVGISVEDCKYRKKLNCLDFKSPVLSLEDPLLKSNEVGRSTFNFASVQAAFAQALQVLKGIFVRDRRRYTDFHEKIFKSGSILALIMPFRPQQVEYRCWLKVSAESQSISQNKRIDKGDKTRTPQLVTNTCVSPYINLDAISLNQSISAKTPKPLTIVPPSEAIIATVSTNPSIQESKKPKELAESQNKEEPLKKDTNHLQTEKGSNEKIVKKHSSPKKEASPKKDGKNKKVTESHSYSSVVYRNTKKQTDQKTNKPPTQSNSGSKKSDVANGVKHSSEAKKSERRPDIAYYNSAARSHRNHVPKTNGNTAQSSDADSEQDGNGFITVRRR